MPVARAPDASIRAIPQGNAGNETPLLVTLSEVGGAYDRIEYEWEDGSGRGNTVGFSNPHVHNPTWTRTIVDRDKWVTVRCNITVYGDGTNADDGTSDTNFTTTRAYVYHLPPADAPSISLDSIPNRYEGKFDALRIRVGQTHSGVYDGLSYRWQVFGYFPRFDQDVTGSSMEGADGDAAIWTRPRVESNTEVIIRCTITARGDGANALQGTMESTHSQVRTTILDFPNATAPTLWFVQHNDVDDEPDPTHHWANSGGTGTEADTVWLRVTHAKDGHYDSIRYDWAWKWHDEEASEYRAITGDQTDGEQPTWYWNQLQWTRPRTATRRQYDLRCIVTVTGDDTNAESNTSDSSTIFGAATATYIDPLPAARAPTINHIQHIVDGVVGNGVPDGLEGTTVTLSGSFTGRQYDRISYRWQLFDQDGTEVMGAFSHDTLIETVLTRPQVTQNRQYLVRLTANVEGRDEKYNAGTTASVHHDAHANIINHPVADAPSLGWKFIPAGRAGTTAQAGVNLGRATRPDTPNDGLYDRLTFLWEVRRAGSLVNIADSVLNDKTLQNPLFTRPDVGSSNATFALSVVCTAHGDGILADEGSTDTSTTVETAVVTPAPLPTLTGVTIEALNEGPGGSLIMATADVQGIFHSAECTWTYSEVGGANPVSIDGSDTTVTFRRPLVSADTTYQLNVSVTVSGGLPSSRPGATAGPLTTTQTFLVTDAYGPLSTLLTDADGDTQFITGAAWADGDGTIHTIDGIWATDADGNRTEIYNESP